jgi:hypothetical protein
MDGQDRGRAARGSSSRAAAAAAGQAGRHRTQAGTDDTDRTEDKQAITTQDITTRHKSRTTDNRQGQKKRTTDRRQKQRQ